MDIDVMDYISGDDTVLERTTMDALAAKGQLNAYKHHGYWQCNGCKYYVYDYIYSKEPVYIYSNRQSRAQL